MIALLIDESWDKRIRVRGRISSSRRSFLRSHCMIVLLHWNLGYFRWRQLRWLCRSSCISATLLRSWAGRLGFTRLSALSSLASLWILISFCFRSCWWVALLCGRIWRICRRCWLVSRFWGIGCRFGRRRCMRWVFRFIFHSFWRLYRRRWFRVWYSCLISWGGFTLLLGRECFRLIYWALCPFLRILKINRWLLGSILPYWLRWLMIYHQYLNQHASYYFNLDDWSGLRKRKIHRCCWNMSLVIATIIDWGCLFSLANHCFSWKHLIYRRILH